MRPSVRPSCCAHATKCVSLMLCTCDQVCVPHAVRMRLSVRPTRRAHAIKCASLMLCPCTQACVPHAARIWPSVCLAHYVRATEAMMKGTENPFHTLQVRMLVDPPPLSPPSLLCRVPGWARACSAPGLSSWGVGGTEGPPAVEVQPQGVGLGFWDWGEG